MGIAARLRSKGAWPCVGLVLMLLGCREQGTAPTPEGQLSESSNSSIGGRQGEARTEEATPPAPTREHQAQEAEAQKAEEESSKSAAVTLESCCRALARRGFEERSELDMAASKLCLAGVQAEKAPDALRPELAATLGERPLPVACSTP